MLKTLRPQLLTFLAFSILSLPVHALTVTTLNLEWFGRGGDIAGTEEEEYRGPTIRDFIARHLAATDLFVFEEITSLRQLSEMMPGWDCRTYEAENLKHQHVAACAKVGIEFAGASTIDSVRLGSEGLRPAYKLHVKDRLGRTFYVIGVHLKAGKFESPKRMEQVTQLTQALADEAEDQTPVVVLGDFNTFQPNPQFPDGSPDDAVLMDGIFAKKGLKQIGGQAATYLGGSFGRTFDRVWTRGVTPQSYNVKGACAQASDQTDRFNQRSFYTRFVSDHCPVTVTL